MGPWPGASSGPSRVGVSSSSRERRRRFRSTDGLDDRYQTGIPTAWSSRGDKNPPKIYWPSRRPDGSNSVARCIWHRLLGSFHGLRAEVARR